MTTDELLSNLRDARASIEKHDPDRGREDWTEAKSDLAALRESLDACSAGLDDLLDALLEGDRVRLREIVAETHADAAALFAASLDTSAARQLLRRAVEVAPADGDAAREARAAMLDLDRFADLVHGRRLWARGERERARQLLQKVDAGGGDLGSMARATLDGPEPMTGGVPTLFTWNGIGLRLTGRRDERDDGSYVATHCISVVWVPLVPLAAYRVVDAGENSYFFVAREKLSAAARRARLAVPLLAVLAAVGISIGVYQASDGRRIARAIDAAAALERGGKHDDALAAYDRVISDHVDGDSRQDLLPAAGGVVRLTAARVAEPVRAASVDAIRRVVLRYQGLHHDLRAPPASGILLAKLVAWAEQIGDADLESRRASLRILELAGEAGVADARAEALIDRERAELAAALASARPVEALRHYATVRDLGPVIEPMAAILAGFPAGSSLWSDASDSIQRWLDGAKGHAAAAGVRASLAEVKEREGAAPRGELVAGGDLAALTAAATAHPHDHGIAVALAMARRDGGKLDEAVAALTALGPPGRMSAEAQAALGSLYADAGKPDEAERVLADLIASDIAIFQDAVSRYEIAGREAEAALIERARVGNVPAEVRSELQQETNPDKQQEIVVAWMRDALQKDSRLLALAGEISRRSHVVPAALSLGMVRLRMANQLTGGDRERTLARAESAFLSVRSHADGRPEFHLGLGQVYFRLGKPNEGEQEFARVLADPDPRMRIAVAQVYRDLGITQKTTELAEKVWNETTDAAARNDAASLLSLVATDLEEEEKWLSRADQTSPFVRRSLMSVRARRKQSEGDMAGADRLFGAIADEYGAEAAGNGTSANNAAVAEGRRFSCTGDIRRLEKAASYMTQAYRLQPESAIVAGNLVGAWQHLALTRVAGTWVDVRALRPERHEVLSLLNALTEGPERAAVRERLGRDVAYRRSAALLQQWQILAPQNSEPYASEIEMLQLLDDQRGLVNVRERLANVTINPSPHRQEWLSGARDESRRRDLARWSAREEQLLAATRGDQRARAAVLLWKADFLSLEAVLGDAASAQAARERALAEAASLWPLEGFERELARVRLDVAIAGAVAASADARAVWEARKRSHSSTMLAYLIAEASPQARDALRRQPQLGQIQPVIERWLADRANLTTWVVAHVMGDAAFETKVAMAMRTSPTLVGAEIDARLSPDSTGEQEELALVEKIIGR